MKKYHIFFLFMFLIGCSSRSEALPTATFRIVLSPSLVPTETAIPPTQTLTPVPTFTPTITPTPIGGGMGKIAFMSERDGYPEIYVMNTDGSNQIKLANEITPKFHPAWSPDGRKIAFISKDENTVSVYIMNADGSNPTKLIDTTEISAYDQGNRNLRFDTRCCRPVWSPDGEKIIFYIVHYIGCCAQHRNSYVINADGSDLIISMKWLGDSRQIWSPDSQKIVFAGDPGIWVMNADGTNLINLNKKDGSPSWSLDGKKIASITGRGSYSEIYVMNADGTNLVRIMYTRSPWDSSPVWSPNGRKIAFISHRDGDYDMYVMNADGTDLVNLTNKLGGGDQAWSPDSTKIAFVSGRDGDSEIYIVDADGNNVHQLTDNDTDDYSPVWSP